jgi:hypothetical protein
MRARVIRGQTKKRLHKTAIRPVLRHARESWTFAKKSESALYALERKVLRRIIGPMKENCTWKIRYNSELYKQFEDQAYQILLH